MTRLASLRHVDLRGEGAKAATVQSTGDRHVLKPHADGSTTACANQ